LIAPVIQPLEIAPSPGLDDQELSLITWVDIIKDAGWCEHSEVECPKLTSVGWVVYEDDKCLKIADTLDEEGTGFGVMAIPKGVILSRKEIK